MFHNMQEVEQVSSYTITLKEMIDLYVLEGGHNVKDKIEIARTKLFDFDYPIFNETYKKDFETHFIRNFFMREIGFETDGLFKFYLENWLVINMPYWNKMFESELLSFDPLKNHDLNESKTKKNDKSQKNVNAIAGHSSDKQTQSTTGSASENGFDRNLESNTPDSRLTITSNDGIGVIEYASHITENNGKNSKSSNSSLTGNNTQDSSVNSNGNTDTSENETVNESRTGKTGESSYSKLLLEYRDTFLKIEKNDFS
jgi:hypothetical protein